MLVSYQTMEKISETIEMSNDSSLGKDKYQSVASLACDDYLCKKRKVGFFSFPPRDDAYYTDRKVEGQEEKSMRMDDKCSCEEEQNRHQFLQGTDIPNISGMACIRMALDNHDVP